MESYDLSSTTPPLPVYNEVVDEEDPVDCPRRKYGNRTTLLIFSLDVKNIYESFIDEIARTYGPKRADRFITWLKVGYIEQFHSDHRRMLKWDRKEFSNRISGLRHT